MNDGKFSSSTTVHIKVIDLPESELKFSQEKYFAAIEENSSRNSKVTMVHVLGSKLNEHLKYSILNPSDLFVIGETSGVIYAVGKPLDREEIANYSLIIEVCLH